MNETAAVREVVWEDHGINVETDARAATDTQPAASLRGVKQGFLGTMSLASTPQDS